LIYVLAGAIVLAAIGWLLADRRKATIGRHRFTIAMALKKAKADKNWRLYIPCEIAERIFRLSTKDLTGHPANINPRAFAGKAMRHPAVLRWRRRQKLGKKREHGT